MLARIRKAQDNEDGFTLIELLVVMIIIGILAAIAIPSFLAQRDKGYQSAVKNDLKTASIAEESYATDNDGNYAADTVTNTSTLGTQGAKLTTGVSVVAYVSNASGAQSYCLVGTSSKTSKIFKLSSADNNVVATATAPTTAAC